MTKIQFKDPRLTKTISLPSFPGSEIVVVQKLLTIDSEEIAERFPNASEMGIEGMKATIMMIARCIKSHNFTDEAGNDIEFTEDVIKQLPDEDLIELTCAVTGKTKEELESGVKGMTEKEKKK